ncbi:rho GTPase-activating protein 24 isoform X1 [Zootoca vivipara]|uniref:rho GTPase-activating protein 24 isoform X1 n=3 Tax=Zootoca vivipara TaxID=8524 RepID=UPI0015900AE1|nr:rho GTPase-activating protein 24 isoform X1 [Zootoca vivipara]XP_034968043.1 rho GTPase-activating protein 24 isoform X1 [Zootoca vivipara]XP_060134397.1 rho GTPase-activating protein 24 isoform X1 [Zootoca vivipara]
MEEHNGSAESPQLNQGRHVAIKCGWLRKQGGFVKTWHTRWFVLKGEQLYYFKDEDETKPLGTIFLPGNRVTEHPCNDESPGKFLFEVIPGGDRERMTANHETYLLMASTQNDMEDWVKSIRRVIWAPFGGGIFGQKLEDTVRYEKRYGNHLAPMLVEQCVDFIRLRGLKEEGLFRLPGQANLVKELQDAFDCGEKPLFDRNTDVHTVASLLKLYLRELPEPVIPYAKYEDFLSCAKLLSKEEETGLNELVKQVKSLPPVNFNLLKYICRFLDEVQSYSGVNKMSVQNLATVFGPNILRPKVEDPLTIMEGTVVVQQLMSMMISEHELLFPKDGDVQSGQEVSNNNNEVQKKVIIGQLQNKENNNTKESSPLRQCSWDKPESPQRTIVENGSPTAQPGSKSNSPRNSIHKLDITRSPPLMVKKNPAFNKGSGIVTNGSFSSSVEGQEKTSPALPNGTLQSRRTSSLKGPVTKMGTHSVQNGGVRMGISSTDAHSNSLNSRNQGWMSNGYVTLRDNKQKELTGDSGQHNRLSTYDNVHQQFSILNAEDKQSVDSATWSTSSCEISLPEHSNSCRSSTTTCPEQDFYGANFEDPVLLDEPQHEDLSNQGDYENKGDRRSVGGRSSRATSSSDNSETFVVNNTGNHSALHSLVSSLKQEMAKQKVEYETRIRSLEQRNLSLETEMLGLHDELEQEKKKFTMVEIKMRNAERAKEDAEKRNDMLQKEMEQFFSTFGELTVETRRPERGNTIWIQ